MTFGKKSSREATGFHRYASRWMKSLRSGTFNLITVRKVSNVIMPTMTRKWHRGFANVAQLAGLRDMGTLIMPDLYLWFGVDEVLVLDTFGNIEKVFPNDENGNGVLDANRYVDEERNKRRWST